jgi:hypothetical protein
MSSRKGALAVVGTGIETIGQMTPAARREIERAQAVFYLVPDPLTPWMLRKLNPRSQSLDHLYAAGKHRLKTYKAMVERVLGEVRRGKRVCFVLYGHPGVFAIPAHAAVRMARSEGFRAQMLPAVSAEACMIADLGVDPGGGWMSYEASDFILRHRHADASVPLVLWQVGVVGRFDYPTGPCDRERLKLLTDELRRTYPARHKGVLYKASVLPGLDPEVREVMIGKLHLSDPTPTHTLFVPPSRKDTPIDQRLLRRLGVKPADRIHCLQ